MSVSLFGVANDMFLITFRKQNWRTIDLWSVIDTWDYLMYFHKFGGLIIKVNVGLRFRILIIIN